MSGNSPKTEKRMKKGETSKYGTTLWSNRASADRIRLGGRFIKLFSPVGRGATLVAPAPLRADMEPPGGPDGQAGCGSRRVNGTRRWAGAGVKPAPAQRAVRQRRTGFISGCCGRLGLADSPCPCGGVVRLPAALDVVDHVLNRDADRAALQTEVLRNELRRHVGEDHTGGGVVEEGVLAVDDPRVFVQSRLRRQVADSLEDRELLLRLNQPLEHLPRRVLVRTLCRDGQEGATPVTAAAGHRSDVPLAGEVGGDVADVTGHPRRAGENGEVTVGEGSVPLGRPGRDVRGQTGSDDRLGGLEGNLRATVHDELFVGVEEADFLLAEDRVEDVRRVVDEPLAACGDVLLANGDEVIPRRPRGANGVAVGVDAGSLEEVAAVAHGQATDVRAQTDLDRAVSAQALLPLPRQVLRLVVGCAEVKEVGELVTLALELDDEALVDRGDVGRARTGDQFLLESLVLGVVLTLEELDGHARVLCFVLRNQVRQTEVAPVGNAQLDRLGRGRIGGVGAGGVGLATTSREEQCSCCSDREDLHGARSRPLHAISPLVAVGALPRWNARLL